MTATVNLLSANQANIESDTSGFTSYTGGAGSISRDTSTFVYGVSCLKVVADGSGAYQYVTAGVLPGGFAPSTLYTVSWYIKSDAASAGKTVRAFMDSSGGALSSSTTVTLTTSWQRVSVSFTTPYSITFTWAGPRIDTGGTAQAVTYWLDCLQVNAGALAPWVPGGPNGAGTYMTYVGGMPVTLVPGKMNVSNQIGQRSTGSLTVEGPLGIRWQYGTQVQLYDALGTLRYGGYVHKDKAYKDAGLNQGQGVLTHDLTLMDNCYKADKRIIFISYLNVSAGSIAQDIVNRVLYREGVTYTATSIAPGVTIPEVIWNGKQISAALDWLAKNSGYWWNIDINGVLWFQPYGGIPAPFVLDGTQAEANENLYVTSGNDQYVNTQYTKGGNAEKGTKANPLHETFATDGARRTFTLAFPVSSVYQVKYDGVDVTAASATKGSNGATWIYAPGDSAFAVDPSQPTPPSGHTLDVYYAGKLPAIGKAQNAGLVAAQAAREGNGSSGIVESVYSDTKVHTLGAALQTASALLAHYGADTTVLDFDTLTDGLMEGQMLTVNLPDFDLNNQPMLVSLVGLTDQQDDWNVWYHVQCVGSPLDTAQFQTFWANLMNQQADPSDLSDVNDTQLTPIATSTFSHTPTFMASGTRATGAIVDVSMLVDNWTVA